MSELSKLLTFMFKEDRSEILKQYNEMLDNAEDEQAMLESFGSPTRLAVEISRSYKRDERKLAVHSDSKDGEGEEVPTVKPVIPASVPKAAAGTAKPVIAEPAADDSYIDIIEEIRREKAADEGIEYTPIFFREEAPAPAPEEEAPEVVEEPAEEAPVEEAPEAEVEVEAEPEAAVEEDAPETEEKSEESTEDVEVEIYEYEGEDEPEVLEEEKEPEEAEEAEASDETEDVEEAEVEEESEEPEEEQEEEKRPTRVAVIPLIFYTILAIAIGLPLLIIMVAAEGAVFCAGVAVLVVGIKLMAFTLSGMTVFADILMCLGVSIAVLAISLLLMWLGLWLIIVSVPGLIGGLTDLGKKLCVREVATDE